MDGDQFAELMIELLFGACLCAVQQYLELNAAHRNGVDHLAGPGHLTDRIACVAVNRSAERILVSLESSRSSLKGTKKLTAYCSG